MNLIIHGIMNLNYFPYISEVEKNYLLEDIVVTTAYEYDTCGNAVKVITNYQGEATDSLTNSYIAKGSWCPSKLHLSTIKKKRSGEDEYSLTVSTDYNDFGQPSTFINDINSPNPLTTAYEYDNPFGMLTDITHSANGEISRQEIMEYDSSGTFIINKTNTLGHYIEMTYDKAYGNILSSTDINGLITEYQYDEFGRLTQTILPDSNQIITTNGWRESTDPSNGLYYSLTQQFGLPPHRTLLDSLGREIRHEKTGFDGTRIFTDIEYTSTGKVDKISEPYYSGGQPEWTEYVYDAFGRKTAESSPLADITVNYNGRTITTTNTSASPNQSVTKTIDPVGMLTTVTDAGGSVNYSYYSSGLPKTVTSPGGLVTSLEFDNLGNRTSITEPNAGTYTFEYNPFGEMIQQNANDSITLLSYDELGRILSLSESEGITTFTYDTKDYGLGKLSEISSPGSVKLDFEYDALGRLSSKTESIDSLDLTESLVYDRFGRDSLLIYPSGFTVKYIYNNNSYLSQIKKASDNSLIWQANSMNARDQITSSAYGNSLTSQFSYQHGHLTGIQMGNIQHLQYEWDVYTGNLLWRRDALRDMTESFAYDGLNRLKEISFGGDTQYFTYQSNGNISTSSMAGSYAYSQDKPHAVTRVTNIADVADTTAQELEYTSFNKVKEIIQGAKELDIYYGANRQRIKTEYQDATRQLTKYFAHDNYEREMGDENRQLHYIMGGTGMVAIMQRKNNVDSLFYVHPDHLGSLVLITNGSGNVHEEKSFDAFGRRRDPQDWGVILTGGNHRFDRGFTGHEHLGRFGLINMNGRMYDAHTARFLSPDLFVQNPAFTQSFNRYSYCVNNPLKFVDPTGYEFGDILPPHWPRRGEWPRVPHPDGPGGDIFYGGSGRESSGYKYDESSPTGYRNSRGAVVSWAEVYYNYILPNSSSISSGLFADVLYCAQNYNVSIVSGYGQDWLVSVNPGTNQSSTLMGLNMSKLNSYYKISASEGGGRLLWNSDRLQSTAFGISLSSGIWDEAARGLGKTTSTVSAEIQAAKVIGNIGKFARVGNVVGNTISIGANATIVYQNPNAGNIARLSVSVIAFSANGLNVIIPGAGTFLSIGISMADAAWGHYLYDSLNNYFGP